MDYATGLLGCQSRLARLSSAFSLAHAVGRCTNAVAIDGWRGAFGEESVLNLDLGVLNISLLWIGSSTSRIRNAD